jgi:DNA-binding transcriptional MerR regulator
MHIGSLARRTRVTPKALRYYEQLAPVRGENGYREYEETFTSDGQRLYKRLTLILTGGRIEHAFYPIFPPDRHAGDVLDWPREHA